MSTQKKDIENNKNSGTENQTNSDNKESSDMADTLAMILIDKKLHQLFLLVK